MAHLERALEQVGLRLELGAAARLHPRAHRPLRPGGGDPGADGLRAVDPSPPRAPHRRRPRDGAGPADRGGAPERRAGGAAAALGRGALARTTAACRARSMPARDLVPGVEVVTDHGAWQVYETPGHAPSHVVLHLPAQRLLLSGDHVLGRISLYFDHGWTPDPVGEFLRVARRRRRARRPALAVRPRPPVHRPPRPRRGQPRAGRRAARRRPGRARRRRARRPRSTSCPPSTARS